MGGEHSHFLTGGRLASGRSAGPRGSRGGSALGFSVTNAMSPPHFGQIGLGSWVAVPMTRYTERMRSKKE